MRLLTFLTIASAASAVHVSTPCCLDFEHTDASFGPLLPSTSPGIVGDLVYLKGDGCSSASFNGVRGYKKVFMIQRGGCGFVQKVLNAQKEGASAVIVYDNTYEGLITMGADSLDSYKIKIPAVFITKSAAKRMISFGSQVVFLSRKDSLPYIDPFDPPFLVVTWMFALSFLFVLFLGLGVVLRRLCCCLPSSRHVINHWSREPAESDGYVEFVEADIEEDDEEDKVEGGEQGCAVQEEELEPMVVETSKEDGMTQPFLVSV